MARSWITEVVKLLRPVLAGHGFTTAGRVLRRVSELGDYSVLEFQASRMSWPGMQQFYVNVDVVPGPWWDWVCTRSPERRTERGGRPTTIDHLLFSRIQPPEDQPVRPHIPMSMADPVTGEQVVQTAVEPRWGVQDEASARWVAERLGAQLVEEEFPRLRSLEDRQALLEVVTTRRGAEFAELLRTAFAADSGDQSELERLLTVGAQAERDEPVEERETWARFAEWARNYAVRRQAAHRE